jgi:hypothetical protein
VVEDGLALADVDGGAAVGTAAGGEDGVAFCGAFVYGGGGVGAEGCGEGGLVSLFLWVLGME